MLEVKFEADIEEGVIRCSAVGHAGYAEKGKDIVCSAATVLIGTLAVVIQCAEAEGKLEKDAFLSLEDGDSVIECVPNADAWAEVLHSFYFAEVGFDLLAREFPDNVSIDMFAFSDPDDFGEDE